MGIYTSFKVSNMFAMQKSRDSIRIHSAFNSGTRMITKFNVIKFKRNNIQERIQGI